MSFTLSAAQLSAFQSSVQAAYADPVKAPVIDSIHKIVHEIATSDPVADRTKLDRWLNIIGLAAWFIPGLGAIVSEIKAIVDAPGGIETIIELAKALDAIMPPLPTP